MDFPLRERTIVIAGPFNTLTQGLMSTFAMQGADIALVDPEADAAQRFCQNINDQREINPKNGRTAAIKSKMDQWADINDAFGRVVQAFGGIDVYLDLQFMNSPTALDISAREFATDEIITKNLKATLISTQLMVGFLKGRKKARMIFAMPEAFVKGSSLDMWSTATRAGLIPFANSLSKQMAEHQVTVNTVLMGLTEEYILAHYPGKNIKEGLAISRNSMGCGKLIDPQKVADALGFLIGPSGASITGQTLST